MALSLKARGGASLTDDQCGEIRRALRVLADPANGCEIRCVFRKATGETFAKSKTFPGSDINGMIRWCEESSDAIGTYFCLNPVPQGLGKSATDGVILHRRWLLVDIDAARPDPNQPSTDAEHGAAERMANAVAHELGVSHDWPEPVVIDSGNGWHLLYRIDLPNNTLAKALVRDTLRALATRFDDATATIDLTVHNASRISKLPGTLVRKGTSTPERPHRVARLISAPTDPQVLIAAKMQAVVAAFKPAPEPEPEPVEPTEPIRNEPRPGTSRLRLRAGGSVNVLARAREYLKKVPPAVSGQHGHTATFVAALKVVRGFDLTDEEGFLVLSEWNRHCDPPWSEKELLHKVSEAQKGEGKRGEKLQREKEPAKPAKPSVPSANGKHDPPDEPSEPLTVRMSDVTPLPVDWLWQNRIPKKFITVLAGRTGIGKSFVTCDIVSRVSRGAEIPFGNGAKFPAGGTLIISEDSHEYVLAPRLIDAGADMDRIHAMTWKAMGQYHLGDTDMLTRAVAEIGCDVSILLIDPPTNFLEGTDEHKNAEVRQLVMKVVEWAFNHDIAILFILHVTKSGKSLDALSRVMGSVAWVTTSRIAHMFCTDPDDPSRCVWVPIKSNIGPLVKAIAYKIAHDPQELTSRIEWIEEVITTADDAMNNVPSGKPRRVVASEWLIERFVEKLEWRSDELFQAAASEGISRNAMFEAKESLGLPKCKQVIGPNGVRCFVWWVPPDWDRLPATSGDHASNDDSDGTPRVNAGQWDNDSGVRF